MIIVPLAAAFGRGSLRERADFIDVSQAAGSTQF